MCVTAQCTNFILFDVALDSKGLITHFVTLQFQPKSLHVLVSSAQHDVVIVSLQ